MACTRRNFTSYDQQLVLIAGKGVLVVEGGVWLALFHEVSPPDRAFKVGT